MKKENGMTIVTMLTLFVVLGVVIGVLINLFFGTNGMFNDVKNYTYNVLHIETQNNQSEIENHYIYENTINTINENLINNQTNTINENTNVQSSSWYN